MNLFSKKINNRLIDATCELQLILYFLYFWQWSSVECAVTYMYFCLSNQCRFDYLLHLRLNKKTWKMPVQNIVFSHRFGGCEVCIAVFCICIRDTFQIVPVKHLLFSYCLEFTTDVVLRLACAVMHQQNKSIGTPLSQSSPQYNNKTELKQGSWKMLFDHQNVNSFRIKITNLQYIRKDMEFVTQ